VAGLLLAQQVTGTALIQIGERDAKAGAGIIQRGDRLQPALGRGDRRLCRIGQQIGKGATRPRPTRPRNWCSCARVC